MKGHLGAKRKRGEGDKGGKGWLPLCESVEPGKWFSPSARKGKRVWAEKLFIRKKETFFAGACGREYFFFLLLSFLFFFFFFETKIFTIKKAFPQNFFLINLHFNAPPPPKKKLGP